jgi:hypothetical protein
VHLLDFYHGLIQQKKTHVYEICMCEESVSGEARRKFSDQNKELWSFFCHSGPVLSWLRFDAS